MIRKSGIWMLLAGLFFSLQAYPQFNLKEKIRSQIGNKANEKVEQEKSKKQETETVESEEVNTPPEEPENGEKAEAPAVESGSTPQVAIKSVTRYDFVPGDKVLFFEDFSQDEIGDFPALWTTTGSGEIRTIDLFPGKWLYMNAKDKVYCLMKDLELPENFIFEFDVVPTPPEDNEGIFSFYFTIFNGTGEFMNDELYPEGTGGVHVTVSDSGWDIIGYKEGAGEMQNGNSDLVPAGINKLNHIIVWIQKRRLRIYFQNQKVVDLPTILYDGIKYNRIRFSNWGGAGLPYITNLRLTTAAPDTRSKLLTEGKLVSYGIYFDSGKDIVKPESAGALNDIAKVLKENTAVRIRIVGHTDSDGNDALNLDLSKKRAAAVKNELEKNYGIEASRIETDGKGETQPIEPNTSTQGKARNRRVEFIKL